MIYLPDENTDVTDSVIVAYDYKATTGTATLIIGKKDPKAEVKIINAFSGVEATELWKKLTTPKVG